MELVRHWRLNNQRYTLTGAICTCCGKRFISQRPVCDVCHAADMSVYTFGQQEIRREEQTQVYEMGQD